MNILFLADINNDSQVNGGYFYATKSIQTSLEMLKKKKIINNLTVLSFKDMKNLSCKVRFDYCFIVINPTSIVANISLFKDVINLCDKKYLHILWETTPLPTSWKPLWNSELDGFFTPSRFFQALIQKETTKPVFYTPYGIESSKDKIDISLKEKEDKFTILFMGQVTKRKGVEDAITAYARTFSRFKNDSQLIIKSFRLSKHERSIEDIILKQCSMNSRSTENLRIFSIDDNLSREELSELYKKSSVLLMPSRGEGFCLPALEAMSIGLPVIYTDWSNLPEVCNPDNDNILQSDKEVVNLPIRCIVDEAIDMLQYNYEIGTSYAVPIMKDLMTALQFKYVQWTQDKKKYYNNAEKNIELVEKYFSFDVVNKYYLEIFNGDKK